MSDHERAELAMDFDPTADPPRDRELARALREVAAMAVPETDWMRLGVAIEARAAPRLAQRRLPMAWWQYAAGWARHAIPVGLAAGVALALVLGSYSPGDRAPDRSTPARATLDEVLASFFDEPRGELAFPATGEDLLRAALPLENR